MSRRPCTFRERDGTRAVRAVLAAGLVPQRVEFASDGRIVIVINDEASVRSLSKAPIGALTDDLDRELVEFEARHGKS
jgi:hypothetical protein